MFEELKIRIWGRQPVPNISSKTIERIIRRDYSNCIEEVKSQLKVIKSDSLKGQNRISAAILKLASGKLDQIHKYVEMYESDFRDVLVRAEYPLCSSYSFGKQTKKEVRTIYLTDWKNYSKWLKGK